jgi:hypothetical protein
MSGTSGRLEGDQVIEDDFELLGVIAGNVTVAAGGYLALHGAVTGNVVVFPDGQADILGVVHGSVWNRGGGIYVSGRIDGAIFDEGGETMVEPNALIGASPAE